MQVGILLKPPISALRLCVEYGGDHPHELIIVPCTSQQVVLRVELSCYFSVIVRPITVIRGGIPLWHGLCHILETEMEMGFGLAGIPGIRDELLERYGVRLVSYDRPGYGQSDPHPQRTLNTSAQDMVHIADALGLGDKFWVLGYSGGGPHAWAALYYIPQRLAGKFILLPQNLFACNITRSS